MSLSYQAFAVGEATIRGLSTDTKPASPAAGWFFMETDTGKLFKVVAGAWQECLNSTYTQAAGLSKISVGTVEPTSPATGDLWVDTN